MADPPEPSASSASGPMSSILDQFETLAPDGSDPDVALVLRTLGDAANLPLIMMIALIVVSPLSGIFFLPTVAGLTIALFAVQLALGRAHPWLPRWLRTRAVPRQRLDKAMQRLRPIARYLDRHCQPRLGWLTAGPMPRLLLLACAAAGATMPFLELIPFSSSLLGLTITLIAFTLLTRDGLWALIALLPLGAALTIIATLLPDAASLI